LHRRAADHEYACVRLIGYWRSEQEPDLPDPHDFVDPDWDPEERLSVHHYLCGGWTGILVPGIEQCGICGEHFTGSEKFDGTYVWPDGLKHYVREHQSACHASSSTMSLSSMLTGTTPKATPSGGGRCDPTDC
jgi:hypothetical protein